MPDQKGIIQDNVQPVMIRAAGAGQPSHTMGLPIANLAIRGQVITLVGNVLIVTVQAIGDLIMIHRQIAADATIHQMTKTTRNLCRNAPIVMIVMIGMIK